MRERETSLSQIVYRWKEFWVSDWLRGTESTVYKANGEGKIPPSLENILIFKILCVCVSPCLCHMSAVPEEARKEHQIPLEALVVVSCPTWMLIIKLGSSTRAASALKG